jgi:hypothetical protein
MLPDKMALKPIAATNRPISKQLLRPSRLRCFRRYILLRLIRLQGLLLNLSCGVRIGGRRKGGILRGHGSGFSCGRLHWQAAFPLLGLQLLEPLVDGFPHVVLHLL